MPANVANGIVIDKSLPGTAPQFTVKSEPCRTLKARFDNQMKGLSPSLVAFGSTAALDRDGKCWSVFFGGGMKQEVEGALTSNTGELLFVWRIPEG